MDKEQQLPKVITKPLTFNTEQEVQKRSEVVASTKKPKEHHKSEKTPETNKTKRRKTSYTPNASHHKAIPKATYKVTTHPPNPNDQKHVDKPSVDKLEKVTPNKNRHIDKSRRASTEKKGKAKDSTPVETDKNNRTKHVDSLHRLRKKNKKSDK